MLTGPPLPLPLDLPIKQLLALTYVHFSVGAWVRDGPRELRLRLTGAGRRSRILISRDLGLLLRRCRRIVLRQESEAVVLEAEVLIRWRALQVVTGIPCLPGPQLLREIFPEAYFEETGFSMPILEHVPEEVLAECITHGIPVAESRIVYDPVRSELLPPQSTHNSPQSV
jgi:hypothetical protein